MMAMHLVTLTDDTLEVLIVAVMDRLRELHKLRDRALANDAKPFITSAIDRRRKNALAAVRGQIVAAGDVLDLLTGLRDHD